MAVSLPSAPIASPSSTIISTVSTRPPIVLEPPTNSKTGFFSTVLLPSIGGTVTPLLSVRKEWPLPLLMDGAGLISEHVLMRSEFGGGSEPCTAMRPGPNFYDWLITQTSSNPHWSSAYESFRNLTIHHTDGIPLLQYRPASIRSEAASICTSIARLSHVKKALNLCPTQLTHKHLTDGQRALFNNDPSPLTLLLKRSQSLPLFSSTKFWYKLALHHAAPGLFYGNDSNRCKLCPGNPKLNSPHLLDQCSLLNDFKAFATRCFNGHPLANELHRHGPWWPTLPNSKVLATFIIITLHVAWKARCSFRYEGTSLSPLPRKFLRLVLDVYRQHVVVIKRRLSHRKTDRKKIPPLNL